MDGGFEPARIFVNKYVLTDYEEHIEFSDSKTLLQEYAQEKQLSLIYELVSEDGPSHDKNYTVRAVLGDKYKALGTAKNKKNAEQKAAYEALKYLKK